jgi:chromosome segregation ATPase
MTPIEMANTIHLTDTLYIAELQAEITDLKAQIAAHQSKVYELGRIINKLKDERKTAASRLQKAADLSTELINFLKDNRSSFRELARKVKPQPDEVTP